MNKNYIPQAPNAELVDCLEESLKPNNESRIIAERKLCGALQDPNFYLLLLDVVGGPEDKVRLAVKTASVIFLKNALQHNYNTPQVPPRTKEALRDYVCSLIGKPEIHAYIRNQMVECMRIFIVFENWESDIGGILGWIERGLKDGSEGNITGVPVWGALDSIRVAMEIWEGRMGSFEWDDDNDGDLDPVAVRRGGEVLTKRLFGQLRGLLELVERRLIGSRNEIMIRLFKVENLIVKCLKSCISYYLPECFVNGGPSDATKWLELLLGILKRNVVVLNSSNGNCPKELLNDMEQLVPLQWEVKDSICSVVTTMFQKHTNPDNMPQTLTKMQKLVDEFRGHWTPQFAKAMISILKSHRERVCPRFMTSCFVFLKHCVVYENIFPQLMELGQSVIHPCLCASDEDLTLWAEDPDEFVQKTYDVTDDMYYLHSKATSLLFEMSAHRRLDTVPLLKFAYEIIENYANFHKVDGYNLNRGRQLAQQKDGALIIICAIKQTLLSNVPELQLHQFLEHHVMPDLESCYSFLRARACWFMGRICAAASDTLSQEIISATVDGVADRLGDPEYPVQVRAAVDLRFVLSDEKAKDALLRRLQSLLEQLFYLLKSVDQTEIVATLEQIVKICGDDIIIHVLPIAQNLACTFTRTAGAEGNEESTSAAAQCILALQSIIDVFFSSTAVPQPEVYDVLEQHLLPVFAGLFEDAVIDHLGDSLRLLSTFILYSGEVRAERAKNNEKPNRANLDLSYVIADARDCSAKKPIISPKLWSCFSQVVSRCDVLDELSSIFFEVIDACVRTDTISFLLCSGEDSTYRSQFLGLLASIWGKREAFTDETTASFGGALASLYLRHCPSAGDSLSYSVEEKIMKELKVATSIDIGTISELAVGRIMEETSTECTMILLRSICQMMYHDVQVVLDAIGRIYGGNILYFTQWSQLITGGKLESALDKKCSAVALLSIVPVDPSSLPVWLQNNKQLMLLKTLDLLEAIHGVEASGQAFQTPALGLAVTSPQPRQNSDVSESTDFSDDEYGNKAHEIEELDDVDELIHLKQTMEKLNLEEVERAIGKDGMARAQNLISKIKIDDPSAMETESTKSNLDDDDDDPPSW